MRISNYEKFLESFLSKDKEKSIEIIISYLIKKIGIDLNPYKEIFHIQKENIFLLGQLFLSTQSRKAIRLNWIKDDLRNNVHSIDIWNDFGFEKNPLYTLNINGMSITKCLPQIVTFFKNPESLIQDKKLSEASSVYSDRVSELEGKLKRARSADKKELLSTQLERAKAELAKIEKRELDSDQITQEDLDFDVFRAIDLYAVQVARGKSNSLIVSGDSGIGKSQTIKDTLKSLGMISDVHFYFSTGTITTAGLYEVLFKNRSKLIVFDDCDAVFKDPDSINILKGALDTYPVREISKLTKGNTFDSSGMSDLEIEEQYNNNPQKLPNKFEFRGQVIFISNLPGDKFDDALISRSLHVDVHLNKSQVIERMRSIMQKINPDMDMGIKEEALEYLIYITNNFPVKFDLNIRTLIHSINLRAGNDEVISIGGKSEPVWKLLIKRYLVKTKL